MDWCFVLQSNYLLKEVKKTITLLGWDGNNERTDKKIIDVLSISNSITFGAPVFFYKKEKLHRYI